MNNYGTADLARMRVFAFVDEPEVEPSGEG
jgi:hypothetical protein